jgi:hypothetical protein
MPLSLRIIAGVLIPSAATIIFNLLNLLVDKNPGGTTPELPASVFDVAVGCTFALFGIGIATRDRHISNVLIISSVALIMATIAIEILVPAFLHLNKIGAVLTMNGIAVLVLSWGISEAS